MVEIEMEEVKTATEPSKIGALVNGSSSNAEMLRKHPLENGFHVLNNFPPKYKRRKISANRDFPKGCGRFVPRIIASSGEGNAVVNIVIKDSQIGVDSSAVLERMPADSDFAKGYGGITPGTDDSQTEGDPIAVVSAVDSKSGVESAAVLEPSPAIHVGFTENFEAPDLLNGSGQAEEGEPTQGVEPLPNALDQPELLNTLKNSEPQATSILELQSSKNFSDQTRPSSPVVEDKNEKLLKKYPPRRRISANRDFPPGCGRNALFVSKEIHLRVISSSKGKSLVDENSSREQIGDKIQGKNDINSKLKGDITNEVKGEAQDKYKRDVNREMTEQFEEKAPSEIRNDAKKCKDKIRDGDDQNNKMKGNVNKEIGKARVRTASQSKLKHEDTKETNMKPLRESMLNKFSSVSKKVERGVGALEGKEGKESAKHDKDKSHKLKLVVESKDGSRATSQSQPEGSSGSYDNRVIVQALMAAPNCPWRQGRRAFQSTPTTGTPKNKAKKSENGEQDKSASASRKRKDRSRDSEGKSSKKKFSPTHETAHEEMGQMVVRETAYDEMGEMVARETSYEEMDQMVLRDKEDFLEHGEEAENVPIVKRSQDLELSLIPFGPSTSSDKSARNKVRETLRLFQVIFRKLLHEEESKSKDQGNPSKRIDLAASGILKDKNKWVNTGKILGPVPGVEVGDEFHYRVELAIVGLHRPFQGGIDYINRGGKILATSIVAMASGGYADDMDSSDVLVYSGSGGKPATGDKQAEDQKLERGNLSLKNSMDAGTVVRVIRGYKEMKASDSLDTRGKFVATYTYDGLYKVEKFWQEKGRYGSSVFKYQLRRIPGQPELALKEVKKLKELKARDGLCVHDISYRKEKIPICAVNTIDDEKPLPFKYITKMIYPNWYNPSPPRGCDCTDGCSDSEKCSCAAKNGGEIPFNYNGAIVEVKPLVYECGPSCKCPSSCHNRVSQHGIKFQLEIFKSESRGWGVRSLTSIPSGSFICEYIGKLLEDKETKQRTNNDEYLFDIRHNYNDHTLWDQLSTLVPDLQTSPSKVVEDVGFTIDAAQYGNVGRFINRSCSPNLHAQNVLYDHDDKRMPHIMLFAAENIPPLQELTLPLQLYDRQDS
uniref:Histone-lysine N-methyltransferase, H3 lysine-9 specific SUVH6-like n=1 Tax=Nelumbo nucifera TaxID=4432 RepID=A0A822ZXS2_NELNU|nr:TPA_asm: hypothetical protein HUJ06_017583 [Nelumbo nucifera]